MLWSGVSLAVASATGPQVQAQDAVAWQTVQKSVAVLVSNGRPCGEAALIDKSGLFLAADTGLFGQRIDARLSDGRMIRLEWRAIDLPTRTALLQAEDWKPEMGTVVTLHQAGRSLAKVPVIVVLSSGPVKGELVADNRMGVLSASQAKRMLPLGEVRFEARDQFLAGSLVFDQEGHLVGLLNATLADNGSDQGTRIVKVPLQKGGLAPSALSETRQAFGPADQTVGYTMSPDVLRRVVTGFLSPARKVIHPAIGVFCKDAPGAGALVQQVTPDTPAAKGGLLPGDIIVRMDDKLIRNQFDFARFMDTKDVGDTISITVLRDFVPQTLKVTVGTVNSE